MRVGENATWPLKVAIPHHHDIKFPKKYVVYSISYVLSRLPPYGGERVGEKVSVMAFAF